MIHPTKPRERSAAREGLTLPRGPRKSTTAYAVAASVTDAAAKEREREAFALMQPSDAKRLEPSDPGRRELKQKRPRKIVKRHVTPRSVLVARQPQFGGFGNTIW